MIRISRPIAPRVRKFTIVAILLSSLIVGVSFWLKINYSPSILAARELERITRDYYENYYYDKIISSKNPAELDKTFAPFLAGGFAPLRLRLLLFFDNSRHADSAKYFKHPHYTCDTNSTMVTIIPEPPFGRKNYTIKYHLDCTRVGF